MKAQVQGRNMKIKSLEEQLNQSFAGLQDLADQAAVASVAGVFAPEESLLGDMAEVEGEDWRGVVSDYERAEKELESLCMEVSFHSIRVRLGVRVCGL